ncbi:YkgJ family cysteine cluster protein [Methylococcaceae bacterium WWC4]|nr:YkgJ family cysteine cluster protein [Methylococcaceae bacterium WWC4]
MRTEDALGFYAAQAQAFAETLARFRGGDLIGAILTQAFSSFDGNVGFEAGDYPPVDCDKGCATCCTLRVTATAPEVLLIERFIRHGQARGRELNLAKRVVKANAETAGLDEARRVALRRRCPFLERGVCMIYPVRPLACRGHACYDRKACVDAAKGRITEIPYSEPHRQFRSLIQNALQSTLRDAGYGWGLYELNQAVTLALADASNLDRWLAGENLWPGAAIGDVAPADMAAVFDRLKRMTE